MVCAICGGCGPFRAEKQADAGKLATIRLPSLQCYDDDDDDDGDREGNVSEPSEPWCGHFSLPRH
jgi:hypothetical protein